VGIIAEATTGSDTGFRRNKGVNPPSVSYLLVLASLSVDVCSFNEKSSSVAAQAKD
jgi:hypothetical protein